MIPTSPIPLDLPDERTRLPAPHAPIVPLAVDLAFRRAGRDKAAQARVRGRLQLPARYLAFSGRYDARKDLPTLYGALRSLTESSSREAAPRVVFAGPFETPEDSTIGPVEASCRFGSADVAGTDLNLFLTTDVKGGVKNAPGGAFFATKKSFEKIYGSATPVTGVGKQAFTAFDGSSSVAQGSLLVLDGKNHAALIVLTGDGVTAETTVEKGKAVAALVLPKLK